MVDYAIEFGTAAADSGWNFPALRDAFLTGLSDPIKDQLAPLELPRDLESLIAVSIRIPTDFGRGRENAGAPVTLSTRLFWVFRG